VIVFFAVLDVNRSNAGSLKLVPKG